MIGIYKITSPSGKIYIGQSRFIENRFKQYSTNHFKGQRRLQYSAKKYGIENHIFEIIEECEIQLLNERERYWQEVYDVIGKNGLNCRLTGTEKVLAKHSEESKHRISNSLRGHAVSEKTKQISSIRNKGNNYALGYKHTQEYLQTKRKSINQFTTNGKLVGTYASIGEAALQFCKELKDLKSKANNIGNCLKQRSNTAFGFVWKYKIV